MWNCTSTERSQNILWFFFFDTLIVLHTQGEQKQQHAIFIQWKLSHRGFGTFFLQHQPNYLSAQLLRGCNNTPSFENVGRLMHHFNSMKADWDHLPVIGTWRQAAALENHFHTFLLFTITLKRHSVLVNLQSAYRVSFFRTEKEFMFCLQQYLLFSFYTHTHI